MSRSGVESRKATQAAAVSNEIGTLPEGVDVLIVGAGHAGFRMLPGGALMRIGRVQPALFGVSGSRTHLSP